MTRPQDRRNLAAALQLVADRHPDAAQVHLTTSDQDLYGFVLGGVTTAVGAPITVRPDTADEVSVLLCNLDWDGAVGEDDHGNATLQLTRPL